MVADVLNLIEADAHSEGIPVLVLRRPKACRGSVPMPCSCSRCSLNLTRNSVDAMRDGHARSAASSIATERSEHGGVRITVTDHGHGVSRQLGDDIFHPFVTTKREGLGVGLAISRTIVQSYGGTLSYRDNPHGGAIFTVELPPARRRVA